MKAIRTKYLGPTNYRGARISASDEDGNRITIPYPHELSGEAVHRKAADALCTKMHWCGRLIGGSLKNGYVFVFDPDKRFTINDQMRPEDLVNPAEICEMPRKILSAKPESEASHE